MKIKFGVVGMNHDHVFRMTRGLLGTGQTECLGAFTDDTAIEARFQEEFPFILKVSDPDFLLEHPELDLIVVVSRYDLRAEIAIKAMKCGKDAFVDKPGLVSMEQWKAVKQTQKETGRAWFLWTVQRLTDPSSRKALELVREERIGKMVNFIGLGPHKLNVQKRPSWFFNPHQYGGILNDLGIYSIEMFCMLSEGDIVVDQSRLGTYQHLDHAGFDDFGDATLHAQYGATAYIRVDWHSPESLPTYGDIRQMMIGTRGMIELRKTIDLTVDPDRFTGCQLLYATHQEPPQRLTFEMDDAGFFSRMVEDIRRRTQTCVSLETSLKATQIALVAQKKAQRLNSLSFQA